MTEDLRQDQLAWSHIQSIEKNLASMNQLNERFKNDFLQQPKLTHPRPKAPFKIAKELLWCSEVQSPRPEPEAKSLNPLCYSERMKSAVFYTVCAINVAALALLLAVWWLNGQDDTWFYIVAAVIVLSSFLYIAPGKKTKGQ